MKPNPLDSLKNFTVPCFITNKKLKINKDARYDFYVNKENFLGQGKVA
jgi:hypothetical protein